MKRKKAEDFDPEVLNIFDRYVHAKISRRGFLEEVSKYAAGGLTAAGLLAELSPSFSAPLVLESDSRVKAGYVEYPSADGYGTLRGYLVKPENAKGRLPTVLVVHENRGLNPHIEDIARRLATDNFIAFAPDALFPLGGYPGDEDKARELFLKLDQNKSRADFIAATDILKRLPEGNGKVGVVGFCYGGGIANFLATKIPDLAAAVPFYGSPPLTEDVPKIKSPLLIHHGEKDERLIASLPAYETALKVANVNYQAFIYVGAQHGFNNDTTPRYDETSAKLAWRRTVEFFDKNLRV